MSEYPFAHELVAGSLDTDGGGHVSNVAFPKYLEVARIAYLEDTLGDRLDDLDHVIANLDLDYRDELFPGDAVTVDVRTTDIGATSLTLEYRMHADGDVAADATTVLVTRDPETGESVRIPEEWRERLLPEARA